MKLVSYLKNRLLSGGADSLSLRLAFRMQAALHGTRMCVRGDAIHLKRGRQTILLGARDLISVPFAVHGWDSLFATLESTVHNGRTVLDFSRPSLQRYRRNGLSFHFPSLAEDDCMEAYVASYAPRSGDVVWDVGAHAGMTTYWLALMVGPHGKVYAFEPDDINHEFLLRNIARHGLTNVTPVKAALAGTTGTASFRMNGTMSAGLTRSLPCPVCGDDRLVETLTVRDACYRFGSVPDYIKMDIEGAELDVVAGALRFLGEQPIHLVFESNHMVGGEPTSGELDRVLNEAGYRAWSSDEYGQRFTWARPLKGARNRAA
jgi:FkbM family methyltransferase